MAAFTNECFTLVGERVLAGLIEGKTLSFTRVVLGDGYVTGNNIKNVTNVVHQVVSLDVHSVTKNNDNTVVIKSVFDNSTIETGFYFREKGIYAIDSSTGEEVLVIYANSGQLAEYIQPGTVAIVEKTISSLITMSDEQAKNISYVSGTYATTDEFLRHTNNTGIHMSLDEKLYIKNSLDDTKDSRVTFSEDATYSEIYSNEKHSSIFAKIKAFFKNGIFSNSLTVGSRTQGSNSVGAKSFASGTYNTSSGESSCAIGYNNYAKGKESVAIGYSNEADEKSIAMGVSSKSKGIGAVAFGNNVRSSYDSKIALGKYNIDGQDNIFEVGIGSSESSRSNAFEINSAGVAKFLYDVVAYKNSNAPISLYNINQKLSDSGWLPIIGQTNIDFGNIIAPAVGSPIKYRKKQGIVFIRGNFGVVEKIGGEALSLFKLPTGYIDKSGQCYELTATSGTKIARIFSLPTGEHKLEWIKNIADASDVSGNITWVSLNVCYPDD